jgi:CheY-like chemotaxis protein
MAKILIVDDDETDRVGLASILEQAGHTVLLAGDGNEALETFFAERVHLVVTDMVMPGRDGLGLISALREVDPGAPIIAISSKVFGARVVLTKPIDREEFLAAVEGIVGAGERA